VLFLSFVAAAPALAQRDARTPSDNLLTQQRLIDRQVFEQRREQAPLNSLLDWQWGGWLEYFLFDFDDGVQAQRVSQRPGLAAWTRLRIDDGAHEFFARVKMSFEQFNSGDEFSRPHDWTGPNLERGWYQIDVGRAFGWTNPDDPIQFRARIGRQEVRFGTGYALDMPLDAVVANLKLSDFRLTGLLGKTIARFPNVDRSRPVANHSARRFFGAQLTYEGFERHEPFAYALWNDDFTDARPKHPLKRYAYDTRYFGIGSRGELAHNFNYWTEWVIESGHSFGDGDFRRRDRVRAWAWDVGIEKLWDHPARPRAALEYMFASGDRGRLLSPTSSAGGNRGDRDDAGFVGFGYRDTGISASPVNSNMHIWRAGGSFVPLYAYDAFRDLEIGSNTFLYYKHHRRAAISDPTAQQFAGYVGWEMDTFVNWRMASDVAWTMRWGMFFPGDAFQDRSSRSFLLVGLTWSF